MDTLMEENMKILHNSKFKFRMTNKDQCCLFRVDGYPWIDFFPGTGRWCIVGGDRQPTQSGGAAKFLAWFENQQQN